MKSEIEIQNGEIQYYQGKKIKGKIVCSDLKEYKSTGITQQYSLKFVLRGEESYLVNGKLKTIRPGQVLIVSPNQQVTTLVKEPKSVFGVCIYYAEETLEERIFSKGFRDFALPDFPIYLNQIFLREFSNLVEPQGFLKYPDSYLNGYLNCFVPFLMESLDKLEFMKVRKQTTKMDLWERIEKGRSFIESNFNSRIDLHTIAEEACLSPFHFQKKFKSFYGKSPSRYLNEIRTEKAKQLIQDGHHPKYVADYCGYTDAKYLKKCLRKH